METTVIHLSLRFHFVLRRVLLTLAVMAACLPGCARQDDYPRQLDYISEINRAMQNLSSQMEQLDDLTRAGEPAPQARGEIVAVLGRMDQSAARLEASGWPSTHPPFDTRLDSFRRDIGLAREAAEREPPDYSRARAMQQACATCHRRR